MLAVQLNLCVGAGAPSAPSSEGGEAATAAYHSITSVPQRQKNVPPRAAHLNISPQKGRNISHVRSAYFTAPQARFHTAALPPYFTAKQKTPPRGGCFCFTAISGDFAAGLYRAFGAVMSALRAGYIFVPSGQKFRCVRRAHTF